MKKILILCICCFLVGCTSQEAVQPIDETGKAIIVDQIGWVGQYQKEDILLTISYDNEYSEGFAFEIEKGVEGFGEYARFQSEDKKTAVYDIQEDGYTLTFTLKHDKIIVEENDGMSYLDVCLSGEYVRK